MKTGQILLFQMRLSRKNLERVASRLALSPVEAKRILGLKLGQDFLDAERVQLGEDTFSIISDWYHYAILSLARIKNTSADPKLVARRLGISSVEARGAIERLRKLGFIEIKRGCLKRTSLPLTTLTDVPSAARKKYHKQNKNR